MRASHGMTGRMIPAGVFREPGPLVHGRSPAPSWDGRSSRSACAARPGRRPVLVKAADVRAAAVAAPEQRLSKVELWNGSKRLQTQVADLAENTVSIRSLDWDRDRFDIEFGLVNGTTYNSYLIFGEKTAVLDVSHEKFRGLYMSTFKAELAAAGRTVDYIIVNHTEPDHSGLVPDVLEAYPEATVVGSRVALAYLKGLTHRPFEAKPVKGGDKLDLGAGHVLEFVMAPNLHWPDTMFTYDHATGVMYTCDAFGAHFCSEEPFDSHLGELSEHFRFYYDCLMRPNARSVLNALKRVQDLEYNTIATGHGPILRHNIPELTGRYKAWSEAIGKAAACCAVLYCGDYGFSDRLSQTLARGITKAGVATEMVDLLSIDPQARHSFNVDLDELREVVARCSGIVLMAPPHESADAQAALATLVSSLNPKKHKVVVAESYGGQDEPVDTLVASFVDVNVAPLFDPLRVRAAPTEATYQGFEEAGTDLAQALVAKETAAKKRDAMSNDVAKALARVSGGLYIVTAANASARGAMVASWVAQASFEPLGLTVAVAKDRAIESLMQVGDVFVVNCLGEKNYGPLMKHFLKRFPPGADRFDGVDTVPSTAGVPSLAAAISTVECRVASRMETADHWIVYGVVTDGQVADPDAKTAVHRRKVASYY